MGDVVVMPSAWDEEGKSHLAGEAQCLDCGSRWMFVAVVGTCWLECPQCRTLRGVMRNPVVAPEGEPCWVCPCGCDIFSIHGTPEMKFKGILCLRCGQEQVFK